MMDVRRDIPGGQPGADLDAQARAWIMRLKSGGATELDLRRLAGWRASSADAERAFDRARRLWSQVGPVLQASADAKVVALRRPSTLTLKTSLSSSTIALLRRAPWREQVQIYGLVDLFPFLFLLSLYPSWARCPIMLPLFRL